jgi:N-acyl-D-aspartate/D-glutamate deacylase
MIHLVRRDFEVLVQVYHNDHVLHYRGSSAKHLIDRVGFLDMHNLVHWFATNESILAIVVTAGVAVLLVCCLGCSNCPSRDKDDLFSRREI